jgi:hypothetical protein
LIILVDEGRKGQGNGTKIEEMVAAAFAFAFYI